MYQSEEYYKALIEKNPEYVGIFYACIKSTSIFCISTCRAKKPKYENTYFTDTVTEAIENGFRPCKICKPTSQGEYIPSKIQNLIDHLSVKKRISDSNLVEYGLRPEYVRRWFKKRYGLTFHAYQRMHRVRKSIEEIKTGKLIQNAAYDNGYESVSGFTYLYKKNHSKSPSRLKYEDIIYLSTWNSPLGEMIICSTQNGICLLEFIDRKNIENEIKDLQDELNSSIVFGDNIHVKKVKLELEDYFLGLLTRFETSIDYNGSKFQKRVWETLLEVKYGETISYKELSSRIGNDKVIRAVASANGNNKISILIPCHRVVGSNGKLRGYGGELRRKEWLLDHEKTCR